MKRFNQTLKSGLGVALATMSLVAFTACGSGGDDVAVSLIKKEYPNAKILSFDEAKKEFGLANKECLNAEKQGNFSASTHFVKLEDGQFMALYVIVDDSGKLSRVDKKYDIEMFKRLNPNCF